MTTAPATASQSSFDFRPFGRMFWKEYRQQWMLWVVMLVLGLALQLAIRLTLTRDPGLVETLFGAAMFLPVLFIIGSSAMLFALEREERTSDWLATLAAPPQWTLLAKFGFLAAGTLVLCGVMLVWALVLSVGRPLEFEGFGYPERTTWWPWIAIGIWFGTVTLFFAAWGTLGSLTARRVVEAVPLALVWWVIVPCVPIAFCLYTFAAERLTPEHVRMNEIGLYIALLGVLVADVWLGWLWCRGTYLDAGCLDDFSVWLSARLRWRMKRVSRVLARVESEFSGWRVWQRLVWQERHRESLHRLLLAVVCAVAVMLPLFSLFQRDSITFAIIGLIAILPVSMGVLGFRFDVQGQQLRFLANRGVSPLAIWLAKHAVWLPRACWIPVVCWGVAWLAEWMLIPGAFDTPILEQNYLREGRHHVMFVTGKWLPHWQTVMWFILLSYGAGQLASLLLRRFVLAAAVSLMLLGVLSGWLALMVHLEVPLWWAVGSLVLWMLFVTTWYARYWLLERQTWSVVMGLTAALLCPPLVVAGVVANYRWLEVPGPVLNSPWLFELLYPQEAERRTGLFVADGGLGEQLKEEIKRLERPVTSAEKEALQQLRELSVGINTVDEFRRVVDLNSAPGMAMPISPGLSVLVGDVVRTEADLPADALDATRVTRAKAAFWAANESRLKELVEVVSHYDRCRDLSNYIASEDFGILLLPQRLLVEAGRLRMEDGHFDEALDYYCASLRLATFWADEDMPTYLWSDGNRQQKEILDGIVEWVNQKGAADESLLPAIRRVREELARFPAMGETVVRESAVSARLLPEQLAQPEFKSHSLGAYLASFLHTEFVRERRIGDQQLFWQWHHIRSLEVSLQQPGLNAPQMFKQTLTQDEGLLRDERQRVKTPLAWSRHSALDDGTFEMVVNREATIRLTLLAMTLLEWKRVHGAIPDSLHYLAPYIHIEGGAEAERVVPVMTLNDPWTGALFNYWGESIRKFEANSDQPFIALYSVGPLPLDSRSTAIAASSVNAQFPKLLNHTGPSIGGPSITSCQGRLSFFRPPSPKR